MNVAIDDLQVRHAPEAKQRRPRRVAVLGPHQEQPGRATDSPSPFRSDARHHIPCARWLPTSWVVPIERLERHNRLYVSCDSGPVLRRANLKVEVGLKRNGGKGRYWI
jgi:hypothetical protein